MRATIGFLVAGALLAASTDVLAATRTWTGAQSNLWSDAGNWGGVAPASGDQLVFPAGGAFAATTTNDLAPGTSIAGIAITGASYVLSGNAIVLAGDVTATMPASIAIPITLGQSVAIANDAAAPGLMFTALATVDLGAFTLTGTGTGNTTIASTVSGDGSLARSSGLGALTLSGDNSYKGTTVISAGYIAVRSATALGSIDAGTMVTGTGSLRIISAGALTVAEPLTIDSAAQTSFFNQIGTNTWSGDIVLGANTHFACNTPFTISGAISGPGRHLFMFANGGITLSGTSNTYSGGTTIRSGQLSVAGPGSIGSGPVDTYLASSIAVGAGTYANALSLMGSTSPNGGLRTPAGATTWSGPITMASPDSALEVGSGGTLTATGAIGGAGGLVKLGLGELVLTKTSTYTSGTSVAAGILRSAGPNTIPDAPGTTCDGTLIIDPGLTEEIGWFGGAGTVQLGAGSLLSTTSGVAAQPTLFSGAIVGPGAVTFKGTGVLHLSGASTYTGPTLVQGGQVLVRGSIVSNSTVTNGATLGVAQDGSLGAVSCVGGKLAPGYVAPRRGATGAITLDSGSTLAIQIDGTVSGDFSKITSSGPVSLGGATLTVALGYAPQLDDAFIIIENTAPGAVSGTFAGLPQGATFAASGTTFRVSYTANDGNDVELTVVSPISDAGLDAQSDSGGTQIDSGTQIDGGPDASSDSGATDGGAPSAPSGSPDDPNDGEVVVATNTGCGCRQIGAAPGGGAGLLAAIAALSVIARARFRTRSESKRPRRTGEACRLRLRRARSPWRRAGRP